MLSAPRFEGTIQLKDDRQLGFAEFGPTSGRPVLWFHGTPGARRQIPPQARILAEELNIRIISVERPGIGASTPHIYKKLIDFADDIEQLSDAMDIEHFGTVGLSGGGPYSLACAYRMPERTTTAVILGGVAPAIGLDAAEGWIVTAMRRGSPLLRYTHRPLGGMMTSLVKALTPRADTWMDLFAKLLPEGDQKIFADPGLRRMFIEDLVSGSRIDMRAFMFDTILFGRCWGFSLADLEVPVHLFYGDSDNIVPIEHAHHMAKRIPGAKLTIREGEGHLGGLGASEEIFQTILDDWPR
jgi:pimeloyl-ACP methyl ester carboxylesterase